MNIETLKTIIKRDITELADIINVLEPGYTLSKIETQIIQTRISDITETVTELVNFVEQELNTQTVNKDELSVITKPIIYKTVISNEKQQEPAKQKPIKNDTTEFKIVEVPPVVEVIEKENKIALIQEKQDKPQVSTPLKKEDTKNRKIIAEQFLENTVSSVNDKVGMNKQIVDMSSVIGQKPITDIHKAIKLNDRIGYIKELFNNNSDTYKQTVDILNNMKTVEEAMEYLHNNFIWDQNSESFKTFIEIIYRRFSIQ